MVNKYKIINTVKIAGAAILAIVVANIFHLEFAISAGIVAILSVQPTKMETIQTAVSRFVAFIAALVIAYLCFSSMGYNMYGFFSYLVIFIFLCQFFSWNSSMAMNSVLISHFLTLKNMSVDTIGNEMGIFIIGAGLGIIVNLHLHKRVDYMEKLKAETDEQIKRTLHRMSERILNDTLEGYDGKCFQTMSKSIRQAKNIAEENFLNQFTNRDTEDMEYIAMRERQIHVLYAMYKRVRNIHTKPMTGKQISDFLEKISLTYHRDNSGTELLTEFYEMHGQIKKAPLPVERQEFEDRAELYTLLKNIEEFLILKNEYMKKRSLS